MDLSTTNVWLALIALATVVQSAVVLTAAILVAQRLRKTEAILSATTRELHAKVDHATALVATAVNDMRPVMVRATAALEDVSELAERARRAESDIRTVLGRMTFGLDMAKAAVTARAWPAVGIAKGLMAGLRAVRSRRAARARRDDALAVARFVNEGGAHG